MPHETAWALLRETTGFLDDLIKREEARSALHTEGEVLSGEKITQPTIRDVLNHPVSVSSRDLDELYIAAGAFRSRIRVLWRLCAEVEEARRDEPDDVEGDIVSAVEYLHDDWDPVYEKIQALLHGPREAQAALGKLRGEV